MGPEIEDVPHLKNRAHFKPYVLSGVDAHHESPPRYTLRTLMKQNNHTFIDILKIDIEGSEFEVLDTLIDSYPSSTSSAWFEGKDKGDRAGGGLPFGQLQLELHVFDNMPWNHFSKFLQWWEKLEIAGLRPFWTEPNLVYVNLVRGVRPDLAEVCAFFPSLEFCTDVLIVLIPEYPWLSRASVGCLHVILSAISSNDSFTDTT